MTGVQTCALPILAKKILYIDREAFIDWYFDQDMIEDFVDNQDVISELKEKGKFSLDINALLDNCGYLPENVAVDGQEVVLDKLGEIDTEYYDEIMFEKEKKFA